MKKTENDNEQNESLEIVLKSINDCEIKKEDKKTIIKFKNYHSKEFLNKIKEKIPEEGVVFILPNGKEYKNESEKRS